MLETNLSRGGHRAALFTPGTLAVLIGLSGSGKSTFASRFPAVAVLLDVPLATCLARNHSRARRVPDEILRAQHEQLPTADQLRAEGFTDIHTLT